MQVVALDAGGDAVEADVECGGAVAAEVAAALAVPAVHLAPAELTRPDVPLFRLFPCEAFHALEDTPRVVSAEQRHAHERARRRVHPARRRTDVHHSEVVAARLRARVRSIEIDNRIRIVYLLDTEYST